MGIKTKILISLAIITVIPMTVFIAGKKAGWFEELRIYEALTEIRGEEAGDVIAILPKGHQWSDTEKNSYLILKLKLRPLEAAKLTQPETKEVEREERGEEGEMGGRGETEKMGRARAYRLKIETLRFNPDELWKGQPYEDKIFDKKLIGKK